jgi:hypothetical protein
MLFLELFKAPYIAVLPNFLTAYPTNPVPGILFIA